MDYIAPKLKVMATEDDGKKGSGWSESGVDASIPVWDGRADSLREYKRTVRWWLSSVDLERTRFFNLAARFAMKQRGSARLCALEFDPKDLEYQPEVKLPDGETGDDVVIKAADYTCGVWKIIEAWENMVGRTTTDKRGELRDRFYTTLKRPPNESVTAFALRYRTLIAEMRAEGIVIDDKEAAWFYKTKLGLSEMQKQMLETTLGADSEDYSVCERESIRLFKRVHAGGVPMQGPRKPMSLASFTQRRFDQRSHGRRPFSSSASTASSNNSNWSRKSPKSVNVTEQDDGGPEEDHYDESTQEVMESTYEHDDGDYGEDESLLQLQTEVECMAAELDELAEQGVEESDLAGLEETLDSAVEALVTMKEAKSQIASLKKDRGFKGPSKGSSKGGQDSSCFACGAKGHWKGDPTCPKSRGKGSKDGGKGKGHSKHSVKNYFRKTMDKEAHSTEIQETNIVDFLAEIPVNEPEVTFDETVVVHEINVVESGLSEALATSAAGKQPQYLEMDKMYIAAVDSACNRSCAGSAWLQTMLDALEFAPAHIRGLVQKTEESERFRFGNGGILISRTRVRLPVLLLGRVVLVWINEIPCDSLGCLLGKDFMEALGTVIDFLGKKMLLKLLDDEKWIKLQKMKAGHFAVNLLPMSLSVWPGLRREPWVSVGTGSICEVQVESKRQWILNKLKTPKHLAHSELNVIEYYVPVDVSGSSFSEEIVAPVPDARDFTVLQSMAQDGDQAVVPPELESQRASTMDDTERTPTVLEGLELSFLEDSQTLMSVQTLRRRPRRVVDKALLEERRRLEELTGNQRRKRIEELIGPRGGLPRLKAELQELCVLCNVDLTEEMTVANLTEKLKPVIAAFKGTGEMPPTRVELAQAKAKAVAAKSSAARPRPEPKAVAVPVLQGTPVNLQPLPSDHRMDPYAAQQIMALRALMAQHGEAGAERDHLGNPILQVEPEEMMRMLSTAAETVDSMSWEPEYGAEAEFFHLDPEN